MGGGDQDGGKNDMAGWGSKFKDQPKLAFASGPPQVKNKTAF